MAILIVIKHTASRPKYLNERKLIEKRLLYRNNKNDLKEGGA